MVILLLHLMPGKSQSINRCMPSNCRHQYMKRYWLAGISQVQKVSGVGIQTMPWYWSSWAGSQLSSWQMAWRWHTSGSRSSWPASRITHHTPSQLLYRRVLLVSWDLWERLTGQRALRRQSKRHEKVLRLLGWLPTGTAMSLLREYALALSGSHFF